MKHIASQDDSSAHTTLPGFLSSATKLHTHRAIRRIRVFVLLVLVAALATVSFTTSSASSRGGLVRSSGLSPATAAKPASPRRGAPALKKQPALKQGKDVAGSAELNIARKGHTASKLADGRVIIVGGENEGGPVQDSEVYDPQSHAFSLSAKLNTARAGHTATRLGDGRILIVGGHNQSGGLKSSELFDAGVNEFSRGPSLSRARSGHTATVLADGRVLIVGGDARGTAEILDLSTMKFKRLDSTLGIPRSSHSAILLKSGKVLIAGGLSSDRVELRSGEIFDPENLQFASTRNVMFAARTRPSLRELSDGKVQVIGGDDDRSMEMFNAEGQYFTARARLVSDSDSQSNIVEVLGSSGRAALIDNRASLISREKSSGLRALRFSVVDDALVRGDALADLLDRSEHTITEIPERGSALITGGRSSRGMTLMSSTSTTSSSATVTTDKTDYAPGETVIISGTGWLPGETVELRLHRDGQDPSQDTLLSALAGANGEFQNSEYVCQETDLGVSFLLTATGQTSGYVAQTTFTDANPQTISVAAPTSVTVTQGATANYGTLTLTVGGSANACNVTFAVVSGLPSGATPVWGTNPITTTGPNNQYTTSFSVATTGTTPPGTYTFQVTGSNSEPTGGQCQGPGPTPSNVLTLVVNAACSAPTITCPANVTVQCDADIPAHATDLTGFSGQGGSASPSSSSCGPVTVAFVSDVASGSCPKTITRTYKATDAFGNTANCTQTITVDDTINPTATPGSIDACYQTVAAANQAALDATTGLTDNCDPSPTKAVHISATVACSTSVVIRVSDSCGNFTDYTYPTRVDNIAPTATQGSIAACYQTVADADSAALAATTNLNDNCDPLNAGNTVTKAIQTSASVACSTSVVIRVSDSCGNFTDYSYPTRVDNIAPTATQGSIAACYQTVADADSAALAATTNLNDNCDPLNAGNSVSKTVETSATAACTTSVVVRVSDSCGNFTDYTYFTRVDGTAPTATQGSIAACYQTVAAADSAALAATTNLNDNCDPLNAGNTVTKAVQTSASVACSTSVVIRVSDSCGNFTDYFYPTRVDATPPTITDFPANTTVSCTSEVTAANDSSVAATDNCSGTVVITHDADVIGNQTCPNRYTITRTYHATDSCGNVTHRSQIITVNDTTPPQITCSNITVQCSASSGAVVNYATPTATDNCGGTPTVVCSPASGSVFQIGTTTVNCTATDSCTNSRPCSFTVSVNLTFVGLFSPYEPPPRTFKAGSSIPLKWQYTCGGSVINSSGAMPEVRIIPANCDNTACVGEDCDPIVVDAPGSSGYHYESGSNTWHFNWKTGKGSQGCYYIYIVSHLTGQTDGPFLIQLKK